jgi:hypothetical protein
MYMHVLSLRVSIVVEEIWRITAVGLSMRK